MKVSRRDLIFGGLYRAAVTAFGGFCGASAGKSASLLTSKGGEERLLQLANELRSYGYRVNLTSGDLFEVDKDIVKPAISGAAGVNIGIFTGNTATKEEVRKRNKAIGQTTGPYDYRFAKRTPQPVSRRHMLAWIGASAATGTIVGGDYSSNLTDVQEKRIKEIIKLLEANGYKVTPPGTLVTPTRCASTAVSTIAATSMHSILFAGHKIMVREGDS